MHELTYVVADSALYTEETVKDLSERILFITRMPATLSIARDLLKRGEVSLMHRIDETYRYQEVCGISGDVKQRGMIIFSQQAYERDIQPVHRRALKQGEREQKAFAKLCWRPFACREDAQRAWEKFRKKTLTYPTIPDVNIREQPHDGKRGNPKQEESPARGEYFVTGSVGSC